MQRDVVKINEDLCDGCGLCVPGCHEGALQIIDGKARLISEIVCDGLGACLGHCPQGAISIENREAKPYNEIKVMETMVNKGKNTVIAHLRHLKEHNETGYLREGVNYLRENESKLGFIFHEVIDEVHGNKGQSNNPAPYKMHNGSCPGSMTRILERESSVVSEVEEINRHSELRQWPVQLHLVNPEALYYRNADLVLAADCTAFAMGDFHSKYLKDKSLAIACPKLDSDKEIYVDKITIMIDKALVKTITIIIMQVPCCMGLLQIVRLAASNASRKVPIKLIVAAAEGNILKEEWL